MDIAANYGTRLWPPHPDGCVGQAQLTGYGLHVIIDHGGNIQTLYAHCSAVNVSVGQFVEQGSYCLRRQHGHSTVTTATSIVRMYGTPVNPASYIGK
jgi:murein DD-endopeptidase MepM/ murein hydrolase activator NlpD